jgi:hypothetical protein
MITRADKGNSLVILPTEQYDSKIADFIRTNDFQTIKTRQNPSSPKLGGYYKRQQESHPT